MFLKTVYSLYDYIINYNNISDSSTYDSTILNVKNNLKKTHTLKRQYYIPTISELNNKIFFINLKYLHKFSSTDLIEAKNKLKKI